MLIEVMRFVCGRVPLWIRKGEKFPQFLSAGCLLLVVLQAVSVSCSSPATSKSSPGSELSLIHINDSLFYLRINSDSSPHSQWRLEYPVFQFQTGDIDGNGSEDILVGVIKATRFDPEPQKRLFIFHNYEGTVRPLWLGSQLGPPLVDFRFIKLDEDPFVRIIGTEDDGKYLVADYSWNKFGLAFNRFLQREINIKTAYQILNE